jgi:hypothetical protein
MRLPEKDHPIWTIANTLATAIAVVVVVRHVGVHGLSADEVVAGGSAWALRELVLGLRK